MRVVAGLAGGIPLQMPKHHLRPTMDKVKGAIFSSLGDMVVGARVLDLFSGSGSLGIEALSRGAASALLVDSNAHAIQAMTANLAKTRLQAVIRRDDVFRFLQQNRAEFDLILADPPYAKTADSADFARRLSTCPDLIRALAPNGIFVLERAPDASVPEASLFRLLKQKQYGASEVLFLTHQESEP